jgi:hypothetical protein
VNCNRLQDYLNSYRFEFSFKFASLFQLNFAIAVRSSNMTIAYRYTRRKGINVWLVHACRVCVFPCAAPTILFTAAFDRTCDTQQTARPSTRLTCLWSPLSKCEQIDDKIQSKKNYGSNHSNNKLNLMLKQRFSG